MRPAGSPGILVNGRGGKSGSAPTRVVRCQRRRRTARRRRCGRAVPGRRPADQHPGVPVRRPRHDARPVRRRASGPPSPRTRAATDRRPARDHGIAVRRRDRAGAALLVDEQVDALDAATFTENEMSARPPGLALPGRVPEAPGRLATRPPGGRPARRSASGESRHLLGPRAADVDDVLAPASARRLDPAAAGRSKIMRDRRNRYRPIDGKGWYDVPYGAITSVDTPNVWAAGRLTAATVMHMPLSGFMVRRSRPATPRRRRRPVHQGRPHDRPRHPRELLRQGAIILARDVEVRP